METANEKEFNEKRYKTFIRVSKTGAWEYYRNTNSFWFSEEYFSMLGWNIESFMPFNSDSLKTCWIELLHDEDRDNAINTFDDFVNDKEKELYENYFRLRKKDSSYSWILSRALKILKPDSSLDRIIGTHINISELKKLEESKLEYEKRLSQTRKLEALGTLSSGIAHDFNNILAAILGNTQMAQKYINNPVEQISFLESIEEAVGRGISMVNEIRSFTRRNTKNFKPVRISPIINEIVNFITPSLPETIVVNTTIDDDSEISADPVQIYQVLLNLCTNSVQAIGDKEGEISILLNKQYLDYHWQNNYIDMSPGNYLKIEICDTGAGMDNYTKEKIFEPFFTTKKNSNTGLGMFLAYGIIKSHGGNIAIHSAPGLGTKIALFLPVSDNSDDNINIPDNSLSGSGENIIIIDEDKSLGSLLRSILDKSNYRTEFYSSPNEAFERIENVDNKFDLVISDIYINNTDTDSFIKKLSEINITVPVLLCSGLISFSSRIPAEFKLTGILHKPFSGSEVRKTVYKILNR